MIPNEEIRQLVGWLINGPLPVHQASPSRGTVLRWEQEQKDRESGEYRFDPTNVSFSEQRQRGRFRELWLLELETDASDMIAAGNDGWPDHFMHPMGLKTAVVKGILGADGWTPLKGKLQTIRELKE